MHFDYIACFLFAIIWGAFFSFRTDPVKKIRNLGWIACYSLIGHLIYTEGYENWESYIYTWFVPSSFSAAFYLMYEISSIKRNSQMVSVVSFQKIIDCFYLWPILLPEAIEFWIKDSREARKTKRLMR